MNDSISMNVSVSALFPAEVAGSKNPALRAVKLRTGGMEHRPVMPGAVLDALNVKPDGIYIDGTFGRGGHARLILDRLGPEGRLLIIDRDPLAIETLTNNKKRGIRHIADWPILEGDIRTIDFTDLKGRIHLLSGGPPCQPFSIGGKHEGPRDARNMWPEAIRAVREARPRARAHARDHDARDAGPQAHRVPGRR